MSTKLYNSQEIKEILRSSNEYHTQNQAAKSAWGKFWSKIHLFFIIEFMRVLFDARKIAFANSYNTIQWMISSYRIMKLTEKYGAQIHITGMNNIDKIAEPVVFISNHMSTFETMVFPYIFTSRREITFVVKDSLVRHKLFGPIMRARNPIVVSRENSREDLMKVINEGAEFLKNGTSVIIFPQSTRRSDFKPEDMNTLGIKLAKKAGVKVVPVAIKTDFWENGKLLKDLGTFRRHKPVHIKIGEPMDITGNGKEEHAQIVNFIDENFKKWLAEIQ